MPRRGTREMDDVVCKMKFYSGYLICATGIIAYLKDAVVIQNPRWRADPKSIPFSIEFHFPVRHSGAICVKGEDLRGVSRVRTGDDDVVVKLLGHGPIARRRIMGRRRHHVPFVVAAILQPIPIDGGMP